MLCILHGTVSFHGFLRVFFSHTTIRMWTASVRGSSTQINCYYAHYTAAVVLVCFPLRFSAEFFSCDSDSTPIAPHEHKTQMRAVANYRNSFFYTKDVRTVCSTCITLSSVHKIHADDEVVSEKIRKNCSHQFWSCSSELIIFPHSFCGCWFSMDGFFAVTEWY